MEYELGGKEVQALFKGNWVDLFDDDGNSEW